MTRPVKPQKIAKEFEKFAKKVKAKKQETENAFRDIMGRLYNAIVLSTPVDTGRARAAWRVEGPAMLATADRSGRVTISNFPSENLQFTFVNGVEYIQYLENGSSRQAPAGMVDINIRRAVKRISAAARNAKNAK